MSYKGIFLDNIDSAIVNELNRRTMVEKLRSKRGNFGHSIEQNFDEQRQNQLTIGSDPNLGFCSCPHAISLC